MTRDFGQPARRRGIRIGLVALVVGIPLLLVVVAINFWLFRHAAVSEAKQWTLTGPPCQTLSAEAFAATLKGRSEPMHPFVYDDITFANEYGNVSCDHITNGGGKGFGAHPVCQFSSADLLKVTTTRGDVFFSVGARPATVSVQDGQASCVRAGNINGALPMSADTAVGGSP